MGKVGQKIAKGLQLDHKWVRAMLIISAVMIVGVLLYPSVGNKMAMREMEVADNTVMDTTITMPDSSHTRLIISRRPASIDEPKAVPPADSLGKSEPLQVQIVQGDKPFDWKGTISWVIGAVNGLVLMFMNLKNVVFKRKP